LLYPIGDKQITQTALDLLGAQAAAWLWAEGAKINKNGSSSLIRVGSTEEEATMVAQWLQMLVGASGKLDEDHVRPRIIFNSEQTKKLQEQLIPYAPKSRLHLFKQESWDVSSIRSARTELQLGKGEHQPQGEKTKTVA
tara:strand:+ start:73 stop:489 length:417 start_codon:yes stop_codon:yes gene_type:complete